MSANRHFPALVTFPHHRSVKVAGPMPRQVEIGTWKASKLGSLSGLDAVVPLLTIV